MPPSPSVRPSPRERSRSAFLRFVTVVVVVLGLLHVYLGTRLLAPAALAGWARGAGWAALAALLISIPVSFVLRRRDRGGLLQMVALYWMGTFGILVTLAL